jgi:hypothetical protein
MAMVGEKNEEGIWLVYSEKDVGCSIRASRIHCLGFC